MKIHIKHTLFVLLLFFTLGAQAQKIKSTTVYMFGVGQSFADSTVYLSSVQRVDSVSLDASQKMLLMRYAYSEQLYQHLVGQGKTGEMCCVFFGKTRSGVEKRYAKLRRRMQKERGTAHVVEIAGDVFRFKAVPYISLSKP